MRGDELLAAGGPRVKPSGDLFPEELDAVLRAASALLAVEANVGPHDGGVTRAQAVSALARALAPCLEDA